MGGERRLAGERGWPQHLRLPHRAGAWGSEATQTQRKRAGERSSAGPESRGLKLVTEGPLAHQDRETQAPAPQQSQSAAILSRPRPSPPAPAGESCSA